VIVLLDNSQSTDACAAELGCEAGQLLTPLTRYRLRDPSRPWGIDNGAFSKLHAKGLMSLLEREAEHKDKCLFVAVPDVVGSARRTLEVFDRWKDRMPGWPLAVVCQDGQEDLPLPWDDIAAVFIGGSTTWKCSDHVVHIIKAAKALGKWAHVGRVNSPARFDHFEKVGADSCDGTGISRYTHMRTAIRDRTLQPMMDLA
jgi:hypothetical protein